MFKQQTNISTFVEEHEHEIDDIIELDEELTKRSITYGTGTIIPDDNEGNEGDVYYYLQPVTFDSVDWDNITNNPFAGYEPSDFLIKVGGVVQEEIKSIGEVYAHYDDIVLSAAKQTHYINSLEGDSNDLLSIIYSLREEVDELKKILNIEGDA